MRVLILLWLLQGIFAAAMPYPGLIERATTTTSKISSTTVKTSTTTTAKTSTTTTAKTSSTTAKMSTITLKTTSATTKSSTTSTTVKTSTTTSKSTTTSTSTVKTSTTTSSTAKPTTTTTTTSSTVKSTSSTSTTVTMSASSTTPSSAATTPTASSGRYVMAHYIVGNAGSYTTSDWQDDITLAYAAGIDAFGLNIAYGDPNTITSLATAFAAAQSLNNGFKLYLNFDYLAWGTWPASNVITLINQYKSSPAYFNYSGRAFVSTFEGTGNINDWTAIKQATNCFFIPDWSSLGASGALTHLDVADGLASWNAWPDGPTNLTTSDDSTYMQGLGAKPFMMPVSPWFYTNLPAYSKNWLWHSDSLWHYRWTSAISLQPTFIQLITWNDYGESHYIGPIRSSGIVPGAWYVDSTHDHSAWTAFLPRYISAFKTGSSTPLTQPPDPTLDGSVAERLTYWYKINPSTSGSVDGTTGNDPSYQTTYPPATLSADSIFFTVLLDFAADITVQIGSGPVQQVHAGNAGLTHLSVNMTVDGVVGTGAVGFNVVRGGRSVLSVVGPAVSLTTGNVNWNAAVGVSS